LSGFFRSANSDKLLARQKPPATERPMIFIKDPAIFYFHTKLDGSKQIMTTNPKQIYVFDYKSGQLDDPQKQSCLRWTGAIIGDS
jgi:hypothetical protein